MKMLNRRDLLKGSVGALALGGALPSFLERALAAQAAQGEADHRRALVVLQLTGGNDGLNTVVPFEDDHYYKARPTIAIAKNDVRKLKDGVGLHSSMKKMEAAFGDGRLAVIQGVGYPQPNRSHFHSMDVWHLADPELRNTRTGWLGRSLDHSPAAKGNALFAVHLGDEAPRMLLSESQKVTSFSSPQDYALQPDRLATNDKNALTQAFERMMTSQEANHAGDGDPASAPRLDGVRRVASQAVASAKELRDVIAKSTPQAVYGGSGVSQQMRLAAQLIGTDLPVHIVSLSMGGFDTHANQRGTHALLWSQIDEALASFHEDLDKRGRAKDVVVMVFSEFGRRVAENGSNGTDHGAAAPMFIFGAPVAGGVIGTHPSLETLDDGDVKFGVDFRSVYSTILERWLRLDSTQILGGRFEPLPFLTA